MALRDGSLHEREKLHPTPSEKNVWNITGGDSAATIQTDCGPIGVMICYDSEFPEVARHLTDQGALILFVPFRTDVREGYLRVRYCSQARAIENQCYVVLSGNVGNLPGVNNFDIQYGQSCILTPSDFPFARDGIAADATPNIETVLFADLRLENLARARNSGNTGSCTSSDAAAPQGAGIWRAQKLVVRVKSAPQVRQPLRSMCTRPVG